MNATWTSLKPRCQLIAKGKQFVERQTMIWPKRQKNVSFRKVTCKLKSIIQNLCIFAHQVPSLIVYNDNNDICLAQSRSLLMYCLNVYTVKHALVTTSIKQSLPIFPWEVTQDRFDCTCHSFQCVVYGLLVFYSRSECVQVFLQQK